jgi:murein DD-endopeptidase MepM/ murein hydrolase activator NlpD
MGLIRRHAFWLCLFVLVAGLICASPPETARTRVADGFDMPVGKPDADGYYKSRGFRANYHMGEDWNGLEGGNRDLGKPVYATAHGIVVLARDMRMSWGNLIIIRHIFLENGAMKTVDSVYAHLDQIMVREGQQVVRGQQVGTIGTAHGMYAAHLHFEIRKNLNIGFNQRGNPRDLSSYYVPTIFINAHRKLPGAGRSAQVVINTFALDGRAPAADDAARQKKIRDATMPTPAPTGNGQKPFRVNRFDDLLSF